MELSSIKNTIARQAIDAWQNGNIDTWNSLFTKEAKLYDDGNPRDLQKFSRECIGHERFISIDKTEDNGLHVYGKFHSDTWGDFKTYFKFYLDSDNRISRLEIGQANY